MSVDLLTCSLCIEGDLHAEVLAYPATGLAWLFCMLLAVGLCMSFQTCVAHRCKLLGCKSKAVYNAKPHVIKTIPLSV